MRQTTQARFRWPTAAIAGLLAMLGAEQSAAATINVRNGTELVKAIGTAKAGDTINVFPGVHVLKGKVRTRHGGTADEPITVKASNLTDTTVVVATTEGIAVRHPYWRFENLSLVSSCLPAKHRHCEHAFHVYGDADHLLISNVRMVDFNASIKGNGSGPTGKRKFPDHVVIEKSFIYNTTPRQTRNPVTAIDVVGGRNWVVRDNFIADYQRDSSKPIGYHGFLKGNSRNGIFERNLVLCEWRHRGGIRVGLSFGGGGGERPPICEDHDCTYRHSNGTIRNNVIANCSGDVGIYVNKGRNSAIYNNLLFATGGIDVRFEESSALLRNNVITGSINSRSGGSFEESHNILAGSWMGNYVGPLARYVKRRLEGQDKKYPSYVSKSDVEWAQGLVDAWMFGLAETWLGHGNNRVRDIYRAPDLLDFTVVGMDAIANRGVPINGLDTDFCGHPRNAEPPDIGPFQARGPECDPSARLRRLLAVEQASPINSFADAANALE